MLIEYLNKKYKLHSLIVNDGDFKINSQINEKYFESKINKVIDNSIIFDNGKISYFAEDEKHFFIFIDGFTYTINKKDENFDYFDNTSENLNENIIKSPMPGSVVNVLVEVGKEVKEGTAILIVSAMKMETTLYSSINGIVKEVNTIKGEQVDESKSLVLIVKE